MSVIQTSELWAEELFGACDLGDKRRTKRLVKLASGLSEQVGKSVSAVCQGDEASLEGSYRFIRNEDIDAQAIGEGAYSAVAKKAQGSKRLLALEDTTTIGYRHAVVEKLGDLGGPANSFKKGFFAHSILLVDPHKNKTIGLIEQNIWKREEGTRGKRHERKKKPYEEKESFKWEAASEKMTARLEDAIDRVISICDREADVYEYLSYKCKRSQHFIVRARHDRGLSGIDETLTEAFNCAPKLGTYELSIDQKGGRQARTTKINVHSCAVKIKSPFDADEEPLFLNMVVAIEETMESNQEPVCWVLLTTEPASIYEEAREIVTNYAMRWHIEEFHKAWKTGAGAERQRMQTANNLERMLVILSFIAVRLLQLREAFESEFENKDTESLPCTTVLSQEEFMVLWFTTQKKGQKKKAIPKIIPNLAWAYREIAKLGGWNDSKRTGRASWLTIWHGWFRLKERLEGFGAAQM